MTVKPNGGVCHIKEQIIKDDVSGLTFQFALAPGTDAPVRMRVFGGLPYGNREILFDAEGVEAGAGTALTGSCTPSWLREVR
ncbi:hypothetical protein JDN40_10710 [Rhodomicrobium vannielii ATCC 17100]|uniref:hypothetical protein n=1 Tax=Rhodomicrobium vannielii TaxID=1069 RepID=UPI00191ACA08|nr:hypothetical protein [Rhodomicrobium vannielii]MBJ7534575.1 hypothetical protein [Rhodomicrobium vannielii ATCC 17100]